MHPELLNNSLFLNYYKLWQENPESIVFAPIAEYFLKYGMLDEAFNICRDGLTRHPRLVSGRLVMAKIHTKRGNFEEAEEEIRKVLTIVPGNNAAHVLIEEIAREKLKADGYPETLTAASRIEKVEEEKIDEEEWRRRAFEPLEEGLIDESLIEEMAASAPPPSWNTITMAKIFAEQGHYKKAKDICRSILTDDPGNHAAKKELEKILNFE